MELERMLCLCMYALYRTIIHFCNVLKIFTNFNRLITHYYLVSENEIICYNVGKAITNAKLRGQVPALKKREPQPPPSLVPARLCLRVICCGRVSVCLSVRLSQADTVPTMAKHRITKVTPHNSSRYSVFCSQRYLAIYKQGHPDWASNTWGGIKSVVFDQYLAISEKLLTSPNFSHCEISLLPHAQ